MACGRVQLSCEGEGSDLWLEGLVYDVAELLRGVRRLRARALTQPNSVHPGLCGTSTHLTQPTSMNVLDSLKDAFFALAGSCCGSGQSPLSGLIPRGDSDLNVQAAQADLNGRRGSQMRH